MPNLAALRAVVFKLFAKNRWGGQNMPLPSSARVNIQIIAVILRHASLAKLNSFQLF